MITGTIAVGVSRLSTAGIRHCFTAFPSFEAAATTPAGQTGSPVRIGDTNDHRIGSVEDIDELRLGRTSLDGPRS